MRRGIDEAQIEHVLRNGTARSARAHRQIQEIDQRELGGSAPETAADVQTRVNRACGPERRHFSLVGFEQDMFTGSHTR